MATKLNSKIYFIYKDLCLIALLSFKNEKEKQKNQGKRE
jgi:hypothetical protein